MSDIVVTIFYLLGISCFLFGLQTVFYLPLSLIFALRRRRRCIFDHPRVSIVVPAFNEQRVIGNCVRSILESEYDNFEIILVDDGSTDGTLAEMMKFADDPRVQVIHQSNGGKASALNRGIREAGGEILFFIDGDTLFRKDTIANMLDGFHSPGVGAVCGHDSPVNLQNWQLKLINLQAHVGTGLVRRALSTINALPIVSGNIGAFRRDVIEEIGGFRDRFIGEDLELTFRVHRAGYRVEFQPWAQVYAESPHTLRGLWNQRVRWARGFIQTLKIYHDMVFNPRFGAFGVYLGFNALSMLIIPVLQLVSLLLVPVLVFSRQGPLGSSPLQLLGWLGLGFTLFVTIYSIALDKAYVDLRYLPAVPFWIPYSILMDLVVLRALYLELRGREALWNKAVRTGVVSKALDAPPAAVRPRRVPVLATGGVLAAAVLLAVVLRPGGLQSRFEAERRVMTSPIHWNGPGIHATAVHFEQNDDWRNAYRTVLRHTYSSIVNTVGVGAGRLDWNYFRWPGHAAFASSYIREDHVDLLRQAALQLKEAGYRVIAIVDLYSPRLIASSPDLAARNYHGIPSKEQLCSTVLTQGLISDLFVDMISYLTRHYPIEGVVLTELSYHTYCYDDRCLTDYRLFTGRKRLPKTWLFGGVNIDDESIGSWRSARIVGFVSRLVAAAHANGKELWVDVSVDWHHLDDHGRHYGQDYGRLLSVADRLVVWDYFAMDNVRPEETYRLARDLRQNFDPERIVLSLGLWSRDGTVVSALDLNLALHSASRAGLSNVWITPSHMFSPAHWSLLNKAFAATASPAVGSPAPEAGEQPAPRP